MLTAISSVHGDGDTAQDVVKGYSKMHRNRQATTNVNTATLVTVGCTDSMSTTPSIQAPQVWDQGLRVSFSCPVPAVCHTRSSVLTESQANVPHAPLQSMHHKCALARFIFSCCYALRGLEEPLQICAATVCG